MPTHHTPMPKAPPKVTPPTGGVTKENITDWILFWRMAPRHAASDEIMARFLKNVTFMIDKVHKDKCFYCAEDVKCQSTQSGSRYYIHKDTQNNCKTSKCSARQIECKRCESAQFTHFHHVHAACPLNFDFCKKLAADGKFMEEFVRMAARKKKEETERLQKQEEKAKKQRERMRVLINKNSKDNNPDEDDGDSEEKKLLQTINTGFKEQGDIINHCF